MDTSENLNQESYKRKIVPWWVGFMGAFIVWMALPWAISWLTPRIGWVAGRPAFWNLLGLILIVSGAAGFTCSMSSHRAESPQGVEWDVDKSYLVRQGLYRISRNPMYLSELILLFGWVIFYGSLAVLISFAAWVGFFTLSQVPREERILEARFGEAYRQYKDTVPRWLGRPRR